MVRKTSMSKNALRFTLAAMLFALSFPAQAQQAKKVPRIGMLIASSAQDPFIEVIRQGLRDRGYHEGKNIAFEYRYAEGRVDRFPDLAAELVQSKVDIIIAVNEAGARAAKNATKTIPIVMVSVGPDPVEVGLVESLARPGGNITGLTTMAGEIAGKRLELFKEAIPKLTRVDALYDPAAVGNVQEAKAVESTGRALKLTSKSWEVRARDRFEKIFAALRKERPGGLYVPGGPLMFANRKLIVDFALKSRIPTVFTRREFVDDGGLMSYGTDLDEHYRRVAYFVDRILKGTPPADLPVERPTKFDFAINLQTAKKIDVTIPQSVLFRADKVIK